MSLPDVTTLSAVSDDGRIICPRCSVSYAPGLVGNACPVCGVTAPGLTARRRSIGDQAVVLVGLATIANLILLAILAIYLLRS